MDILQQIIEMDKEAAARVEALRLKQESDLSESGKAAAQANEKAVSDAQQELESFRAQQQALLDEKHSSADSEAAAGRNSLDDIFSAHREEWISDIIEKVTGV